MTAMTPEAGSGGEEERLSQREKQRSRADVIDRHIGTRIRDRRKELGISQGRLGEALDLAFQQVQKYESGANSVSSPRLYDLARELNVPIGFFFDGVADALRQELSARQGQSGFADAQDPFGQEPIGTRDTLEVTRLFNRLSAAEQKTVVELLRVMQAKKRD